jgi:hypothetical protein
MSCLSRVSLLSAVMIGSLSILGCGESGPSTVKVTGTLTQGGQPVTYPQGGSALLDFFETDETGSVEGGMYSADVKSDGTYEILVPVGKYKVQVQLFDKYPGPDKLNSKYMATNTTLTQEVTGAAEGVNIDVAAGM